jgi:hypothetical protein
MRSEYKGVPEPSPLPNPSDLQTTGKAKTFEPTPTCQLRPFQVGTTFFSATAGVATGLVCSKVGELNIGKSVIFSLGALIGSVFCLLLLASLYDKCCKKETGHRALTSVSYYEEVSGGNDH